MTSSAPIATVFGGSGFLGHAVVQALAQRGYIVRIPTRDLEKTKDMKLMGSVGQIVPFLATTRSDIAVATALEGSDVVINLIGLLFEKGKNTFQSTHVETAARIARIARSEGVKHYIHLSALGADAQAKSSYARTKALGEEAVRAFFPDAVILRPSVVFGPRDSFLFRFMELSRFLPFLPLIGGGKTRFQPVFVGDIAAAICAILGKTEAKGRIFALTGQKIYTFRELMSLLLKVTKRRRFLLPVPWLLAYTIAFFFEFWPHPPLTRDQMTLLKTGVFFSTGSAPPSLQELGLSPTPLEDFLAITFSETKEIFR